VQRPDAPLVDSHVHVFRKNMPLIDNPRHSPDYEFTANSSRPRSTNTA
jgi:predicted TIM-barrel fold metal-dependent hydrolase